MPEELNLTPDILCQRLAKQLGERLPGANSHLRMLPPGRVLHLPADQPHFIHSAVLVLLFPFRHKIMTCLIRRPSTMKNHAGQIAFPGGKQEKEDRDLAGTALREANEEIGLAIETVQLLGTLTPVYVQVSNFLITPVVAWSQVVPEIRIDPSEVDEAFFITLEDLVDQNKCIKREVDTSTGRITVPGFEINGCFIWGATAMLLSELGDIYRDIA
jgi:8-oxo-dGTP pyrophosphatase MutT (NUDIX family)